MGMSAYGLFSPVAYGPTYPAPAAGDVTAAGSSVEIDAPTRATRAMSRSTSSGPIERGWDEPWYRAAAGLERLDGQRLQRRSFDGEQLADRAGTGHDAPGFVGPDPTRRSACSRAPASRSRGRERSGCGEPSRSGPRRRLSRGRPRFPACSRTARCRTSVSSRILKGLRGEPAGPGRRPVRALRFSLYRDNCSPWLGPVANVSTVDIADPKDLVRRGYDAVSLRYDEMYGAETRYQSLLGDLCRQIPAGGTVLDLGCGGGVPVARTLAAAGYRVTGRHQRGADPPGPRAGASRRVHPR